MRLLKKIIYFTFFWFYPINSTFCQSIELNITIQDTLIKNQLQYKQFHKNNASVTSEYNKVLDSLNKIGYLNLDSKKTSKDSIVQINIYLKQKIDSIQLIHPTIPFYKIFKNNNVTHINSSSIKIPFNSLETTLNKIASHYEESGDSFVEVSLTSIKTSEHNMHASIQLTNNRQRSIDKVIVKGYPEFPKKLLKNELQITNTTVFNKKTIGKIDQLISKIDYLNFIRPSEILFSKDSTILYMYIEKKSQNYLDGLIGFSTNKENDTFTFNGHLNVLLNNSFNKGEKIKIAWQNSTSKINELALSFFTPYIYNSKISPTLNFSITKQDSTYSNTKFNTQINYKLNFKHALSAIYEQENSKITQSSTKTNFKEYKKSLAGISYNFKSIQENNLVLELEALTGNRNATNKNTSQNKFKLYSSIDIPILQNHFISIKTRGELLESKNYLENELFRIGGSNSIRGFDEYSVWTDAYALTNLEYHFTLDNNNTLYTITDYAYVNNSILKQTFNLYGFGIGYRLKSENKILNLSYAVGKQEETPFNLKNSKLHINIVYIF